MIPVLLATKCRPISVERISRLLHDYILHYKWFGYIFSPSDLHSSKWGTSVLYLIRFNIEKPHTSKQIARTVGSRESMRSPRTLPYRRACPFPSNLRGMLLGEKEISIPQRWSESEPWLYSTRRLCGIVRNLRAMWRWLLLSTYCYLHWDVSDWAIYTEPANLIGISSVWVSSFQFLAAPEADFWLIERCLLIFTFRFWHQLWHFLFNQNNLKWLNSNLSGEPYCLSYSTRQIWKNVQHVECGLHACHASEGSLHHSRADCLTCKLYRLHWAKWYQTSWTPLAGYI